MADFIRESGKNRDFMAAYRFLYSDLQRRRNQEMGKAMFPDWPISEDPLAK